MICMGCRAGADNMDDYRAAARTDDERRQSSGEPPMSAGAARRWIKKRARLALALHCQKPACTCQCLIPELNGV
jgi:hypothetical protein